MTANIITIGRVVLAFVAIGLFSLGFYFALAAFLLTIFVIWLDSLDGYVARKLGVASDFGALLDITGDRIVENIYWIYFAAIGLISFWIPVIVITRSFLVDTVRSVAFSEGKTPFGEKTMMKSGFSRALTSSALSRSTYAISKVLAFCYLGGLYALNQGMKGGVISLADSTFALLHTIGIIIAYVVVVMCIVRGVPVLWDGKDYVLTKRYPREIKDDK
jgi:CDP-diacylglycerol--glycerol-3-phosphate 3-phosphatidyltransferase